MGMIQGLMRKAPDGKAPAQYLAEVQARLPEFAEGSESAEATILKEADFDECWDEQENLKQDNAVREKYRDLAKQGRVVYVRIDW